MNFRLGTHTVWNYLLEQGLCQLNAERSIEIEPRLGKNFNLLVRWSNGCHWLVKQESHDAEGNTSGDVQREWSLYQLLRSPALSSLKPWMPEGLYFDESNSILISNYFSEYSDLAAFYDQTQAFPESIAAALGAIVGAVHRKSWGDSTIQHASEIGAAEDEEESDRDVDYNPVLELQQDLQHPTPDLFGRIPIEGLKFYALCQRYASLNMALSELAESLQPCCLIHNDLKFNNILLHQDWQRLSAPEPRRLDATNSMIRLIDWEKWDWGDPALDLGTLIASYLNCWLSSLLLSREIDLAIALPLAGVPLVQIQPSLVALIRAYLQQFNDRQQRDPRFLRRIIQCAGFVLIRTIHTRLHYQEPFDNTSIGMLQVGKTLLCEPEAAMQTIFGAEAESLMVSGQPVQVL
ncbi:MAG: phosphotransferase [Synechococcales cyanobacterium M58_A2018_015]|nr:phosphotransferase [Synechococcales cyanobacterium M58_A2018_015]